MKNYNIKYVLIVDDEPEICSTIKDEFEDLNEDGKFEYVFKVDTAFSYDECKELLRKAKTCGKKYDVMIIDVRMKEDKSGLDLNLNISILKKLGWETPIRIIVTAYPRFEDCVNSMRFGAWDYIEKIDEFQRATVKSATQKIRQIDLKNRLEHNIAQKWIPTNLWKLEKTYCGQLIAIWDKPNIEVIAAGVDTFELEENLKEWRTKHETWEQPFIVSIPD